MGLGGCNGGKGYQRIRSMVYLLIGGLLIVLALFAVLIAGYSLLESFLKGDSQLIVPLLSSVGLVVLALALFDVGSYLIEEEVIHGREMSRADHIRHRLTKFLTILVIALGLEALVYVFKVGRAASGEEAGGAGLEHLMYPTLLIVGVGLLLVSLGGYQYLSLRAEQLERSERSWAGRGPEAEEPEG